MIEVIWILTFYITGIYKQFRGIMPEVDEITKVIKAVTYSTLIVMALTFVYPIIPSSRSVILYAWIGGIILLSLSRLILNYMDVYILKKGYYMTPTLIIGANDIGQDLAERFIQNPSFGYRYIGTLDSKKPKEIHYHLKKKFNYLGKPDSFEEQCRRHKVKVIFITKLCRKLLMEDIANYIESKKIQLNIISDFYKFPSESNEVMTLDGVPFLSHFPMEIQKISIKKRLFDIMASIGLLIILYLF